MYDLGGSNQAILSDDGSVGVNDITSYLENGGRIYFETGEISAKELLKSEFAKCAYGYIDIKNFSVVVAINHSDLENYIQDLLRYRGNSTNRRSCSSR